MRFRRGRRCSLQHDGNKEQMESTSPEWINLHFSLSSSLLLSFLLLLPFLPNFFIFPLFYRSEDIRWPLHLRGPQPSRPRVRQRDRRLLHQNRKGYRHRWGGAAIYFSLYFTASTHSSSIIINAVVLWRLCSLMYSDILWIKASA